ncbi:MAG: electron transfer flavoprotein subunit alpha/FixB family protein [Desulfarculales bacterium]|jgi:electron transfer flavoprotein alpha subunit|nr:electron transfer flavoprotein subunit alpha/FixB family protein [Desulfarculales bacterium]
MTGALVYLNGKDNPAAMLSMLSMLPPELASGLMLWSLGEAAALPSVFARRVEFANPPPYLAEVYLSELEKLTREFGSRYIFFANSFAGNELAPRLAARTGRSCLLDIHGLSLEGGRLTLTRDAYNSNMEAVYTLPEENGVFSLDAGRRAPGEAAGLRLPLITNPLLIKRKFPPSPPPSWFLTEVIETGGDNRQLEEADFVIVGGQGMGNADNFALLEELGRIWEAQVGASRPAAANGWLNMDRLVGQSGVKLSARLCLSVGVSGAAPFLNGIQGCETHIAVNNDKDAPVFAAADLGLAADGPELIRTLLALIAGEKKT